MMRLIDADAVNNAFESEMCKGCSADCVDEYGHCNCYIHYLKELLWQQPTAYDVDCDKCISEYCGMCIHNPAMADCYEEVE